MSRLHAGLWADDLPAAEAAELYRSNARQDGVLGSARMAAVAGAFYSALRAYQLSGSRY